MQKMRAVGIVSLVLIFLVLSGGVVRAAERDGRMVLWHRQPAPLDQWTQALPLGNGRMGAMMFGGVERERIQMNEDTIWSGERKDRKNPRAGAAIPVIRRLLLEGKVAEAEALAKDSIIAVPPRLPNYEPLGDLHLTFPASGSATDYHRELDLATGIAMVRYKLGGVAYTREAFVSAPDQLVVVRLTADKPRSISFSASMTREADAVVRAEGGDSLLLESSPQRQGSIRFRAVLKAVANGGQVRVADGQLTVDKADTVVLVLAMATNMDRKDPALACAQDLKAARKPYNVLRAAAISDHARYFNRMRLKLAGDADPFADMPTDERLKRVQGGGEDPHLLELYFQYGRYLLIACSRPDAPLPANLQGIWNQEMHPAWGSKFTVNINTEMNYWIAEPGNLAEMAEPLYRLIDATRGPGADVAKKYYGARGFVVHHNTDIFGDAVPVDGYQYGTWAMGGAWLSLQFWEHYDFTRDQKFLGQRAYPVMKEAAEFVLDYLTPDKDGHLVTGPSLSPENQYKLPDGSEHSLSMGPVMDIEIARALFERVIAASTILNRDAAFRDQLQAAVKRLPPFKIGRFGQLQEWQEDYTEKQLGHRHISHLWGLYPGDQIDIVRTPDLAKAARVSIERRLANRGARTGWSRAWVVNYWARLGDGEKAYESLMVLLRNSTLPDLFDTHPPFQIDGNFGGAAAITEMLLQSQHGELRFLPALPKAWSEGSLTGMRARGGWEVALVWSNGKATTATLRCSAAGPQKLRAPSGQEIASLTVAGRPVRLHPEADGSFSFQSRQGGVYELKFK